MRVLAQRVIDQQLRSLGVFLRAAWDAVDNPPRDTPARADLDHVNGHPDRGNLIGLRWWTHRAATLNIHATKEHLKGVRRILAGDELLPLPAMALARSVYEAVINTCWLIDVEVSTEQRLARWAGRLLHDSQEVPNALDSFGDKDAAKKERQRTVEGREIGQRLMASAGFELLAKGNDRSGETARVTYGSEKSSLTPVMTDAVKRFTPDQQSLWKVFSGAAHSQGWLVSGLGGPIEDLFASIMTPLLDTGDALAVEVGRYFGMNPREAVTRLHRHRTVLLRRARPSPSAMRGVDDFRAASGLWPLPPRDPVSP